MNTTTYNINIYTYQIMLFSEGFVMAKVLSKKMTGLFDLMKEQMSKQDHYDYGLRNTKSILVAAGMRVSLII